MKSHRSSLRYFAGCNFHNKIWFANGNFNGLFSLDLSDFSVQNNGKIPFLEENIQWAYYGNAHCCYNNKIFFFPSNCSQILVYDTEENSIQGITVSSADGSENYLTVGIIQQNEKVWLFPSKLEQGIFILDLKTLKLERTLELDLALEGVRYIHNVGCVIQLNETEIGLLSGNDTIIIIDMREKRRICCKRFESDMNIWGIRYDGHHFWLLSYDSVDVYEWAQEEDRLIRYQLLNEEWIQDIGIPYTDMIFWDNHILVLPCCLKHIMRIDRTSGTIRKAIEYPEYFSFLTGEESISAFGSFNIVEEGKVLLPPVKGNMLLLYNFVENSIEGRELMIRSEEIPYIDSIVTQKFQQENGRVFETKEFGVEMLDLAISKDKVERGNRVEEQIGRKIYEMLI